MQFVNLLKRFLPEPVKKVLRFLKLHMSFAGFIRNDIVFPIGAFMRRFNFFPGKEYKKIEILKNRHKGERCFIIATGPSLRVEDVNMLRNEVTFGLNSCYKIFEKCGWKPTYYVTLDPLVIPKYSLNKEQIEDFSADYSMINSINAKKIKGEKIIPIYVNWLDHWYHDGPSKRFKYEEDLKVALFDAYTVTNASIFIAMYMGFKEIYLLGVDNDYTGPIEHAGFSEGEEAKSSYESAVYTQTVMDSGYKYVAEIVKQKGVQVVNCTRGGKLEIFPRSTLENVMGAHSE